MLEVIGAGFGRTGTLSLRTALERLGFSRCHHMMDVIESPAQAETWRAAADGLATDWDALFEGYRAAVDWPTCYFWRELSTRYPQARVILTLRDAGDWYDSARATIYRAMTERATPGQMSMSEDLILHRTFGDRFGDRDHACRVFDRHTAEVQAALPAERLLVYRVAQGWPPLCEFLGCEVPDEPFPNSNSTAEFERDILARR